MVADDDPRPAVPGELPAVTAVVHAAFVGYSVEMDRPPAPMLAQLGPRLDAGEVWVAGRPVAAIACLAHRPTALEVEILAVDPAAQGRGLGRRLLDRAADVALATGLDRLVLSTNEVMTDSAAVYRHLGFVEVDRRVQGGYRRIFLELDLGRRD